MSQLSPTEFSSAVTAITSAFGDPTRREIYLFAHERPDGVSASDVASRFGLHANVARHHLDKLCAGGYLEISTRQGDGSAGRPSKRYRAVRDEVGIDLPVRQDEVLVELLGRALAELGEDRAAALAEDVGVEFGRRMATAMGERSTTSFRTALHAVADALSSHGFAANARQDGSSLQIITQHCPFGDTAVEHPVVCAVDRGMVAGMLGTLYGETSVEVTASTSGRDGRCVTSVHDPA